MTKTITRDELMVVLKEKFPKMWVKPSEALDGSIGDIWTGEGSYIDSHGVSIPMFSYYDDNSTYELGIHKELVEVLNEYGWYAEFYDAGTVFLTQE